MATEVSRPPEYASTVIPFFTFSSFKFYNHIITFEKCKLKKPKKGYAGPRFEFTTLFYCKVFVISFRLNWYMISSFDIPSSISFLIASQVLLPIIICFGIVHTHPIFLMLRLKILRYCLKSFPDFTIKLFNIDMYIYRYIGFSIPFK